MTDDGKSKLTSINEIGEFGLIDRLTNDLTRKNLSSVYGVGDDSAVIEEMKKQLVVSTEIFTEGAYFNLVYTPFKHLGYKIIVAGISDIYAMNATPSQVLVSLAVSSKFSAEALDELYEGIKSACQEYQVDLVGGDVAASVTGMTISVTSIGRVAKDDIVYRTGAQKNDIICVSGDLGRAFVGLQLLERERKIFEETGTEQPELKGFESFLQKQLKPGARADVLDLLKQKGIKPTSMIDVSDGLASDMMQICKASGKGCKLFYDRIPVADETVKMTDEFGIDPVTAALNGGEDYELLFTVPIAEYEKIKDDSSVSMIGHIAEEDVGMVLVTTQGHFVDLKAQGWSGNQEGEAD